MKRIIALLCVFVLLLCGCAKKTEKPAEAAEGLNIAATTYPVYCLTTAVCEGVEGVKVTAVVNQQISCLHDYTLTVDDMRVLESAQLVIMNGLGLEDFMNEAIAAGQAETFVCSEGVETLPSSEGGEDQHIWLDPTRAAIMAENIGTKLAETDSANAETYLANAAAAADELRRVAAELQVSLQALEHRDLITFHDGFSYFADAFSLNVLRAIEEESGSEASAKEIAEIVGLVRENDVPAIFVEENGADATAKAIQRELGGELGIGTLSMIMSGEGTGIRPLIDGITKNVETIAEYLG